MISFIFWLDFDNEIFNIFYVMKIPIFTYNSALS